VKGTIWMVKLRPILVSERLQGIYDPLSSKPCPPEYECWLGRRVNTLASGFLPFQRLREAQVFLIR
jgi:hypothetical protein